MAHAMVRKTSLLLLVAIIMMLSDTFVAAAPLENIILGGQRQLLKDQHGSTASHQGGAAKTLDISFTTLTRSGASPIASPKDLPMGGLLDQKSQPIFFLKENGTELEVVTGQQHISQNPDFTSIIKGNDSIYAFTHFEGPLPSQLYHMELKQDKLGGLTVVRQQPVDFSKWGGLWLPCAGSLTPWGTHLGSEEYEPDAKPYEKANTLDELKALSEEQYSNALFFMRYFGKYPGSFTMADVKKDFNPYKYGYITELHALAGFKNTAAKHYAMGRKSNEMGVVMPDQRTVYMSDDGTNTAQYKFIADEKADLSSGTLYMGKVLQHGGAGASDPATTRISLKWIRLGKASQAQIEALVNAGTKFSDIFEEPATKVADKEACPSGFTSINAGQAGANRECLKLKPGQKKAAAFLETRRYGAMLGGTTEWSKIEGTVYSPMRNSVFFAVSDVRYGMEDTSKKGKADNQYDIGGRNDIKLKYNQCGCVYEMKLNKNYNAHSIVPLLCGTTSGGDANNPCSVDGIANPDNLELLNYGDSEALVIGEDTSEHQNDMIWVYDLDGSKKLTRVATSTYGAEFTGTSYYEIGKFGYMTTVQQHPYGESDEDRIMDPESTGLAGTVGYMGPYPLKITKGKKLTFAEIDPASTNAEKHNIRVSSSVRVG